MTSVRFFFTICLIVGPEVTIDDSSGLSPIVAPRLYIEIPQVTRTSIRNKHASDSECNKRADCGSMKAYQDRVRSKSHPSLH